MKKIISYILLLAMCVSLFVGCAPAQPTTPSTDATPAPTQPTEPTQPAVDLLENARAYLAAMYKDDRGTVARRDFSVVASVVVGGETFAVVWTTDTPDYVTITPSDDNKVLVDIVEAPTEEVNFKLIATMTDAKGNTVTVEIPRIIEAVEASGVEWVSTPAADTAYKYAVQQNNLGQTLYFAGALSGNYVQTTTNPFESPDVFVEEVEGGSRLYFMDGETKTYIEIIDRGNGDGKVKATLTTEPSNVWTWDAERKTFTMAVNDSTWYLGCYNTFNTFSASDVSYIADVTKIGDSQFPTGLATVNIVPEQASTPVVGTAYKYTVMQNTLGQTLYFNGKISGNYLATSVNPGEGVNVFVEEAEGGLRLYFVKGEEKNYIEIIDRGNGDGKVKATVTTEPSNVWTWDAERKTFTMTVNEATWYLGCYNTFSTFSASDVSYIADVSKIGDSQFPAGLYTVEGFMDLQPAFEEEVVDFSTMTAAEIVAYAYGLKDGEAAPAEATLTGVITEVKTAWSDDYKNITVIIEVEGKTIECFCLKGDDASALVVGDTITVTGILKNFSGTVEFDSGCKLSKRVPASVDPTEPTLPTVPTEPTEPTEPVEPEAFELKNGDKVVIYVAAYGKALSTEKTGYYNVGVDVTMKDGVLTGFGATEVFTVIVNADGTYSFAYDGKNLGLADSYSSMNLGEVNDKWNLTVKEGTTDVFYLENVVRGNFIEWYAEKNNWSSYKTSNLSDLFELSFYIVK